MDEEGADVEAGVTACGGSEWPTTALEGRGRSFTFTASATRLFVCLCALNRCVHDGFSQEVSGGSDSRRVLGGAGSPLRQEALVGFAG